MNNSNSPTMRSLEDLHSTHVGESALDNWYRSIRDIPVADLSIGDIARCVRQGLFPDNIVPLAMMRLHDDPLVGEMYDGELLVSLRSISETFWRQKDDLRTQLQNIISGIDMSHFDPDEIEDIEAIKQKLMST